MKKKKKLKKSVKFLFILIIFGIIASLIIPKIDYFKKEEKNIEISINYEKVMTTKKGVEIDLLNSIKATNNLGEDVPVSISGTYNFNKVGEYNLEITAKSNDCVKKENFILKVLEDENTTSKGFKIEEKNGLTYIDGYLVVNKTYSVPEDFGNGLTDETMDNFNKLKSAALLEGLNIFIASGYRSYDRQKTLYENYAARDGYEKADTYSARPGHSEHQTGLAMDVNEVSDAFTNTPEAIWMSENCYKYGFILRYPKDKTEETGFKYEPWHFRYVGQELAEKLYNNGDWLTMEDYFGITSVYKD